MSSKPTAHMVLDSISPDGIRMMSIHMRLPRCLLAELNTHRMLSKNARSSRAVPVPKMIAEIMSDPYIPLHWGAHQTGMQAYGECDERIEILDEAHCYLPREKAWLLARDQAVKMAQRFFNAGYAKQIVNRLLEPFMWVDVLVSGTEWSNFIWLRDHHAAEPHMQMLAKAVVACVEVSTPQVLKPGEWHLPYITDRDQAEIGWGRINSGSDLSDDEIFRRLSAARCARISYTPFDGNGSIEAELKRYDSLMSGERMHASPVEHIATPDVFVHREVTQIIDDKEHLISGGDMWESPELHGNLRGWIQFRKTIPNENHTTPLAA